MRYRATRIPIQPEAFSLDLRSRHKHPRQMDQDHLKFIRTLPCLVCGTRNTVQAAHLRTPSPAYGKRATGIGEKPADKWSLPLCAEHHDEQHRGNEMAFWAKYGVGDPFAVCLALYAHSGDDEACELVIKMARAKR